MKNYHGPKKGIAFYHGPLTLIGISNTLICQETVDQKRIIHVEREPVPFILKGLLACVR